MSTCALTSGFSFDSCKGGGGGIKEVLITEFGNLVTAPTLTANVFTAFALSTGKQFRRYVLDKEMGSASSDGTYTSASGTWTYQPKVEFTIKKFTTAMAAEIKLIAQNTLILIVRDVNDIYRVYGTYRGMDLMTATDGTGTAMTDLTGFKLSFEGKEITQAYEINAALITTLLAPAV